MTIALGVWPVESGELYEQLYQSIEEAGASRERLNSLPVLSDLGSALTSFCSGRKLRQYFCHRHILERFGEPSLRNWAQRLLRCPNIAEYDRVRPLIHEEITIWREMHKQEATKKLDHILAMLQEREDSRYSPRMWAIWERLSAGVARCTNHSESLHRILNRICLSKRSLNGRFLALLQTLIVRFTSHLSTHGRSLRDKLRSLKFTYRSLSESQKEKCRKDSCECGWGEYYTSLFGVRFPCIHQVGHYIERSIEPPALAALNYRPDNWLVVCHMKAVPFPGKQKLNDEMVLVEGESLEDEVLTLRGGPQVHFAKQQFWCVVKELTREYYRSQKEAIEIAIEHFARLGLCNEETASLENIAIFRVSCWSDAAAQVRKGKTRTAEYETCN